MPRALCRALLELEEWELLLELLELEEMERELELELELEGEADPPPPEEPPQAAKRDTRYTTSTSRSQRCVLMVWF